MKIFIYKTIIISIVSFLLFEITIGYRITKYRTEITSLTSKENLDGALFKIKKEIKSANKKENYFSEEDRILLSTFVNKIIKELKGN
jgi:hypothetical protein